MDKILGDFHVAALRSYANDPDDFNLEEFIKEYTGTPIFKLRLRKEVIEKEDVRG
jgi:hypothetical protein